VFWLNVKKDDENQLANLIDELKQARMFSRVVRDGIRLMVDLWHGNLDLLLELFPWVEDAFYQRFIEQQPTETVSIQEQLHHLERLLLEQGSQPISSIAATNGNPKPLLPDSKPRPLEIPDDDDLQLVVKQAASDGKASQNFLDSAFSLIG
jgi:hypothetical protein